MFSLICAWKKNGCANDREAGDFRRYRADYDVTNEIKLSHNTHLHTKSRDPNAYFEGWIMITGA